PPRTLFGYYGPDQFDPDAWRGFYANPAFERMTERDGAWFARIAARFTDEDLDAIARVGDFSDPAQTAYLAKAMAERRDIILRRYFGYVSPISDATLDGDTLCAVDLARRTGVYPKQTYRYEARASGQSLAVDARDAGQICMRVPHLGGYIVVEIRNGQARGALKAHLYDLGPAGFQLAGLERPDPGT